jgi:PAS domain S-box-containing protein
MKADPLAIGDRTREHAANEGQLRALLECAVDAIISIDERGIIQMVNPAAERIFGYSAQEMVGKNVSMLMPSPYREEHDAYVARYRETGQKKIIGIGREVVGLKKDGTTFPLYLAVAEARLGSWRGFVGIIRDITDRKNAEKVLLESKENLEKLVAELRTRDEEVRTMTQQLWLAAKMASVGELAASIVSLRIESVLARTPATDPRRRALEIIEQETHRMGNLVANLLQFSRRGPEQISTVDLRQELTQAVELVYYHLRKRQIRVVQELAPDTPAIYADRQKLRQVFLNLITNASDAMPAGGTLTLRSAPVTLPGNRAGVQIDIEDTGVGIAAANLRRIFDPFFTTKEEGKGTGLGLAICRRVIEEHQGNILIESEVDRGTRVRMVLPVQNFANAERVREAVPDGVTEKSKRKE